MDLADILKEVQQRSAERAVLSRQLASAQAGLGLLQTRQVVLEQTQTAIQTVAKLTQEQLTFSISELCSLALDAVFPDPYKLNLDFDIKHGKTAASITFSKKKSEDKVDPIDASGGGAVDVAAFALRIALWSLQKCRTRPVMLLDEPFKFLSTGLQEQASAMLRELSKRLKIQFIIVTHEEELISAADQVFNVALSGKRSVVTEDALE